MQASVRVMPCCFITGEAAGIAAALAAASDADTRHVDVPRLQEKLLRLGSALSTRRTPSVPADYQEDHR